MEFDIKIPTWDEYFLKHCYITALKSKDKSTQIGSIIVKNQTIISSGWNGFPRGIDDYNKERVENRDLKLLYTCHSEFNAIINCARNGISTLGSIFYTFGFPCNECSKSVVQAGIKEVVIHKEWMDAAKDFYEQRWKQSKEISAQILKEANVLVREVSCKIGSSVFLDKQVVSF